MINYESWATGDWDARYKCGTSNDDNGYEYRSERCKEQEAAKARRLAEQEIDSEALEQSKVKRGAE